jgi:putative transposase
VHRSSFQYWNNRKTIIKPDHVRQLANVKRIHKLSNGSAGARTVAEISTAEGRPMSRYIARKRMIELDIVSCQVRKHRYKYKGQEHIAAPNIFGRESAGRIWRLYWIYTQEK